MFSVDVKHSVYLLVSCYRKPHTFVFVRLCSLDQLGHVHECRAMFVMRLGLLQAFALYSHLRLSNENILNDIQSARGLLL